MLVELFTYIRVQVDSILTYIVIFRRNTVQRYDRNRWKNLEIKEIYFRKYKV